MTAFYAAVFPRVKRRTALSATKGGEAARQNGGDRGWVTPEPSHKYSQEAFVRVWLSLLEPSAPCLLNRKPA